MTIRGAEIPLPAIVGSILTFAVCVARGRDASGRALRRPGLARRSAIVVFVAVRRFHGEGLTERVIAPDTVRFDDVPRFRRILVPMKLGIIGEEMAATAVKLADEHRATVEAMFVVLVPLELPLDAPMPDAEARAAASLEEAKALGAEHGVDVQVETVRARAIGKAIVERARATRRRPDRARLLASLAPAVALLLADGRLRAPPGAVRGAHRRVPAAGARRGAGARPRLSYAGSS